MLSATIVLASRMLIVAAIVVATSVAVVRSGPVLGAMLATLPITAGPAYVFLAMDYGGDFVAQSAIGSILAVSATASFIVAHQFTWRRGGTVGSLLAAVGATLGTIAILNLFSWTLASALAAAGAIFLAGILVTRRSRREAVPFKLPSGWLDLAVRAVAVMAVVGGVTILGDIAGPLVAGYAALIPVVFMSMVAVLQPQVGGAAMAGLLAHAMFGTMGFVPSLTVVHLATRAYGVWWGLALALLTALCWNGGVLLLRRAGLLRI